MTDARVLLRVFTEEWEAGLRPNVETFLAAAPAHQQSELAGAVEAFLCDAPLPRYDDETLAELESSQPVREAAQAIDGRTGTWPLLLPSLRRQRRLTRAEVAQRLATELGFSSAHRSPTAPAQHGVRHGRFALRLRSGARRARERSRNNLLGPCARRQSADARRTHERARTNPPWHPRPTALQRGAGRLPATRYLRPAGVGRARPTVPPSVRR